jgi:membrane protein required for colicin V production
MHWLDITLLIVLGIGAALGFWSGLLWQVARVVSLGLSLYLAVAANASAADWLGQQFKDTGPAACRIIAFGLVFAGVYLFLYLFTRLIHQTIKEAHLELVDRFLGALLGMAKMAAILSGVCAALTYLALPMTQDWLDHSALAANFAKGAETAIEMIPREYRDRFDENLEQARDQLQKRLTDAAVESLSAR